jgi:hypothetical protein
MEAMKSFRQAVSVAAAAAGLFAGLYSAEALAYHNSADVLIQKHRGHGGHSSVGVGIHLGVPLTGWRGPAYQSYPYAYPAYPAYSSYPVYPVYSTATVIAPPAVYVAPANTAPQVIQQNGSALPPGWWYYCPLPEGYYPHVQACSQPWQAIEPRRN